MDPNKPANQIYGMPYSKVEYPVGIQPNVLGGTQQGIAAANSSQMQYNNMLQMMYGGQNVLPLGLQPQLYQYHAALAGLNVFPGQFAGQIGQTGGQMLQQPGFQGFTPTPLGYAAYPFMPATAGLAGVQNGVKDGATPQQYAQAPAVSSGGSQPSRARDEGADKDKRQRSRDRDHNKKQKDQGKPREKDQPPREQVSKQSEGPGRQTPNQRGLSDSRQPQHNQYSQKNQYQAGGNDFRNGPDRRHREDRDSREREKSRIREGREGPGFGGGYGHNQGGNFQNYRKDDDRDNYRRDKDFRNNQGPPRQDQDRFRDQMPNRDRDRDQRRDFDRDRPVGDSWKNKDKMPDKLNNRDRDRERDRERERDRDRQGRDNRPERYEGREPAEKESGSLGFREITKPMDNIEGNTIPKDRPVSYMCIESNVARKAVVIEMVKFKIGKYFLEDKAVQARQAAEGDDEAAVEADPERECPVDDDELGLSDEEDLYHLTFRKRYYNDSEICGACFKEGRTPFTLGHTEKGCPERFRSVCWMCLGNHNKDECVNIACFRCNGSGHKNSNCPMRDSNSIPFCQKCKKRSHLERDCSMLNLSFSRIIQEKDAQQLMICTYCGLRGHLPSMHFKNEMMDIEEQAKEATEPVEVLHHTNSRSAADAEPQLDWQNVIHSDDGDEDALPSLYEPKESMQRENSSVLRMLSRESAEKANPPPQEPPSA